MPKISVLMPVYNTKEEYLREAIESILNQTYTDFELIIMDDGSTLKSNLEVLKLYETNPKVKIIYSNHVGIAAIRNKLLDMTDSEYCALMDSDDISLPHRFEVQINYFETHPEISILGSWFEMFPRKKIIKNVAYPKFLDLVEGSIIGNPTVMFRKQDFDKYNLRYSLDYKCEDYELWSRAVRYLQFANIQEVLLKYRWYGGNSSGNNYKLKEDACRVQQNMLNFLTDDAKQQAKIKKLIDKNKFIEKIFSVKNTKNGRHKVITIAGIKIKFKNRKYNITRDS